tara:strand:- start:12910 stop:13449 length:540 start_codon:yes stop_codon:yes gene_type:complete
MVVEFMVAVYRIFFYEFNINRMSTGITYFYLPSALNYMLPRSANNKQCLTHCVAAGGEMIIHPISGNLKTTGMHSECAVKKHKTKKGKTKEFDKCFFYTYPYDPWLTASINWPTLTTGGGKDKKKKKVSVAMNLYRAILQTNFGISSRKEGKVWLSTRATDLHLVAHIKFLLDVAYPKD